MVVSIYKTRVGLILPALTNLADRNERIFLVALQIWMDFAHKQIRHDLTSKYIKKDVTTELTDWEFIEEQGKEILKPATLKIMQTGGSQAYKILQAQVSFDVLNPEAVKAAEKFCGKLVRGVTAETKKNIRRHIQVGVKEGMSMNRVARDLKKVVGLTASQGESVRSYRNWLGEKRPDLSAAQVDKRVMTYTNKTHRRRMQTIARTETARAQNIGYVVGLEDLGVDQVEFQIHPDEKTCDECSGMDGKKYKVGEGQYLIPVHPNCRCCLLPVVADKPTCRMIKMVKQITYKAECIPPSGLHDKQIEDLLKRLKAPKTPAEGRKIRRALRRLGHKGGLGGKPPVTTPPAVKPTVPTVPKPKEIRGIPTKGTGEKLTSLDKDILRAYSEGDYKNMVPIQLGGKYATRFSLSMKTKMLENAGKLEKTLLKLNGWEGTSYRGMTFSNRATKEAFLAKLEKKGIYKAESFLATSKKLSMAEEYGKYSGRQSITMIIDGRSGRDIARYWGGTMKEVLFMKNSPFKVVKVVGDKVFLKEVAKVAPRLKPVIPKLSKTFYEAQKEWVSSLTREERYTIGRYSSAGDQSIVNIQRDYLKGKIRIFTLSEKRKEYLHVAQSLEKIIDRAPGYNHAIWRGMNFKTESAKKWKVLRKQLESGKTFTFDSMQSFTVDKTIAMRFADEGDVKILLRMKKAPKRSALIEQVSLHPTEEEVIVGADAKYKVVSKAEEILHGVKRIIYDVEEVL